MLVLFTDTDTDITPNEARDTGYRVISMPFTIDGETVYPYESSDGFEFKPFYDKLRAGVVPSTSGIGIDSYTRYFEPVFAAGGDILYVHFSRAMSGTFEAMDSAVAALLEKYPERKFYTVDTRMITIGSLAILREIGRMVRDGASAEDVLEWAKTEVDHYAVYFFADDLRFFRHSGRVSGLAGIMGTLLGVRPIIHMSSEGKMVSVGSERGRERAIARLLRYVDELGEDVKGHRVIVGNTDAPEIAAEVTRRLKAAYGEDLTVLEVPVNPTTGGHCGPNGVGICFHAKHR